MNGMVSVISNIVCQSCHSKQIKKDGCSASLKSAPSTRLIIDMDCKTITKLQTGKNCDYIFIGEDSGATWVVPIELKGGKFKGGDVAKQLQDGIDLAAKWIPSGSLLQFVPILFRPSNKGVHRNEYARLRKAKIKFQHHKCMIEILHCGKPISSALKSSS